MTEQTFDGFSAPTQNFFRMPNNWTDITAKINNLAELKVVEYVLRHTWGYQEYGETKTISLDEFMNGRKRHDGSHMDTGTGLSKPSVIEGIKKAIKDGLLLCEIDDSDKARVKKSYRLKMVENSDVKDLYPQPSNQMSNIFTPDVKDLYPRCQKTLHRSEKETLERNLRKKVSGDTSTTTQPENTHTSFSETSGYENGQPSMQLSTQANCIVDNSQSESRSQKSYSQNKPTKPPLKLVKNSDETSDEASAVCVMYDEVALGEGKRSGHAPWDLKAAESLAAEHATEEEIRLVYNHLKKNNRKYTIVHVWESWAELATLKKPAASPGQSSSDGEIGVSGRRRFRAPEGFGEPRKVVGGVK